MDDITKLCRLWQRRLRLANWKIQVKLVSPEEMPDALGKVTDSPELEKANIVIQAGQSETDTEETLVHELIHIYLNPWCENIETFGTDNEKKSRCPRASD